MIYNKCGSDHTSINPTDRKKKTTKIVVITTTKNNVFDKCIPLSISSFEAKVHDTNTIVRSVMNIPDTLKKTRNIDLVGDKGYILRQDRKNLVLSCGISVVTPFKKNQKKTHTPQTRKILRKRRGIENCFSYLKNYNRIATRRDRNIVNYIGFVFLGCIKFLSITVTKKKCC